MSFLNRLQFEPGPTDRAQQLATIRLIDGALYHAETDPARQAETSDLKYFLLKVIENEAHLAPRDTVFS